MGSLKYSATLTQNPIFFTNPIFFQSKPPALVDNVIVIATGDDLFDDLEATSSDCSCGRFSVFDRWLELQRKIGDLRKRHHAVETNLVYGTLAVLYNAFFFYALYHFCTSQTGQESIL
jgi:hypothetical protein